MLATFMVLLHLLQLRFLIVILGAGSAHVTSSPNAPIIDAQTLCNKVDGCTLGLTAQTPVPQPAALVGEPSLSCVAIMCVCVCE